MIGHTVVVLYTSPSIISSSTSALTSTLFTAFSPRTVLAVLSPLTTLRSAVITLLPALSSLFLSPLPGFLTKEVTLDVQGCMIAGVLLLLGSGVPGEGDFKDGEEAFLADSDESLLSGLIDINNFLLSDVDDLVQSLDLSTHDLSNPEGLIHKLFSSLDGHEGFALTEEESKCAGNVATCMF